MQTEKRNQGKPGKKQKKELYPVVYVTDSLKEYQKDLVQKEVDSLRELNMVNKSFRNVLKESENFQEHLQDFGQSFSSINQVSEQFTEVKSEITDSVEQVQKEVDELKNSSRQVESHFSEMENTFKDFLEAVKKIKRCTSKKICW